MKGVCGLRRRGGALVVLVLLTVGAAGAPAAAQEPAPITASGAVLWDPADQRILHTKAATVPRPMASTTKIMTVLLALESGDLDEEVVVTATAAAADDVPGAATLGLRPGQTLPLRNLLAALMLRSGNDAAAAVAEHIAGSETAFVAKMNARAGELGLDETNFVDASGLTDNRLHRASPLDLAELAAVAMGHPEFAAWAGSPRLSITPFGTLENRNTLLTSYAGATGVKTGFTRLAGLCLVASAERDGRVMYAVVLGSEADPALTQHFSDAAALLDHGFTAFRRPQPVGAHAPATVYRWSGAAVPLVATEALARTVSVSDTVTWRTVVPPDLPRPLASGARAGRAELVVDGEIVASVDLVTAAAVPAATENPPAAEAGAAVHEAVRAFVRLQPFERAA